MKSLEHPPEPEGPRPTRLRVRTIEGGKAKSFSIGLGLARWMLSLPGVVKIDLDHKGHTFNTAALQQAIASDVIGKVFEAEAESYRIEMWLV